MFYISCSFKLVFVWKKNISPNLTNSQELELHVLEPLGPKPLEKKIPVDEAGAAWEKNQEPEPKSQEPELLKNNLASQPCL